jgi:hypothetical protein
LVLSPRIPNAVGTSNPNALREKLLRMLAGLAVEEITLQNWIPSVDNQKLCLLATFMRSRLLIGFDPAVSNMAHVVGCWLM